MFGLPCVVVLVVKMRLLQGNSGEICCSRPSETNSPRRDWQGQTKVTLMNSYSGRVLLFWARHCLSQVRDARLSEKTWKPWGVVAV